MAAYLFHFELAVFSEEVNAIIPQHRELINRLFAEGRILSYSVSIHRNMIWCVINAEDEQEAMELAISMPMYPFFIDVSCTALWFHNELPVTLPGSSLN